MKVIVIVGTRPEVIKMTPIIKELEKGSYPFVFIHTGQHYDYELSKIFLDELSLPEPDYSFRLNNSNPISQIGEIMIKLEKILEKEHPLSIVLIQGDTNTMLASGLSALKMGMRLGHVEAGLRSYDWRMPEEHNRRMIDHVSNYLFAPTEWSKNNLIEERVAGEIYVTGNTVIDSLNMFFHKIENVEEKIVNEIDVDEYVLLTFHRAENVDDIKTLTNLVRIIKSCPKPIVFPIHPRTKLNLKKFGLWNKVKELKKLKILPPLGYFEFVALLKNCSVVLTDSGGLQEEATYPKIRKPVLVLRTSTERPEAVAEGFAKIVGTNPNIVIYELKKTLENPPNLPYASPFGDGKAAQRIIEIVKEKLISNS